MQTLEARGTLNVDEETLILGCAGYGGVAVQITGNLSGTIVVEGTLDGENFSALILVPVATTVAVTSVTSTGLWRACVTGLLAVRARCSEYSSGAAAVVLRCSESSPTLINLTGPA